ncbi:ferrous iron transport protein B [Pseudothermotoga thermarum]|uniref:Ferrous iron transport protein B n=1 Tax=Pseudothermotoga thermarum DSM 5069 TaxID=688269 RepID=F7YY29_9THEM|nr:ferrous iron transport protein B [Pseudothermotoga thermarum]AEH50839.1 ferrous iron transport protein B [Pseudothermotoga thermarum DSM 5069]
MSLRVALCGNPNVGKTSLFNALTGLRQYVANWAGVTVEIKKGVRNHRGVQIEFIDLPGTYSLSAFSEDEKVARNYLLYNPPNVLVVVMDALALRQSMYLLFEVIDLDVKIVGVVNAIDEARRENIVIDKGELSKHLGIPIIFTSAVTGEGIEELLDTIVSLSRYPRKVSKFFFGEEIEKQIEKIAQYLSKQTSFSSFPTRWLAIKYLEGDPETVTLVGKIEGIEPGQLREKIISQKYEHVELILKEALKKPSNNWSFSEILDHAFTHKYIGIPIFFSLMYLVFSFAFDVVQPVVEYFEDLMASLGRFFASFFTTPFVASLIEEGIFGALGAVLVFIPNIFALFFVLGIMEESGYLPRAAFVMDRLLHFFKLTGRSFISFLLGFGCSVPAIMSTRGIMDRREKTIVALSIPFVSCSARLPVYMLIASIFFERNKGLVVFFLYLLSISIAMISSVVLNKILFKGQPSHLILELPRYRMPTLKNLVIYVWNRGKHFLIKAGTIIFSASILLWVLTYFPYGTPDNSFASQLGKFLHPILKPLGFDWKLSAALVFGVGAKEIIVSALGIFFGFTSEEQFRLNILSSVDPSTALAFLVFVMAYIPCIATIATISSELGKKYALFSIVYSFTFAYALALLVKLLGGVVA